MELATAHVKVRADTSGFEKDLKHVEKKTQDAGQSIFNTLTRLFGAAVFTRGIRQAIDAASDLNETVSKTKILFGEDADAVIEFGKDTAREMGMSKKAYLDAAAGLKGLLDNMGLAKEEATAWSQDLVALGGDLASFFNTAPADAIYAISASLRGEQEPIRRYNVQLNEMALKQKAVTLGLYDGKGALDLNAKAQAALALIMEQTTAAQGDFKRTADGVANSTRVQKAQMEDASASAGQSFLPIYQKIVMVIGELAAVFGALPAPVQAAIIALIGLVALSGPIINFIALLSTIGATAAVSMGALALLAIAATTVFTLLGDGGDAQGQLTARSKEVTEALQQEIPEIIKLGIESGRAAGGVDGLALANQGLNKALVDSAGGDELVKRLGRLGLQADDAAAIIERLDYNTKEFNREQVISSGLFGENATKVADYVTKIDDWDELTDQLATTLGKKLTPAQHEYIQALADLNDTADDVSLADVSQEFLYMEVATSKNRLALVELAKQRATHDGEVGSSIEVYRAYLKILAKLTPEQYENIDSIALASTAVLEGTSSQRAYIMSLNDTEAALIKSTEAGDIATVSTQELADSLGVTEERVNALKDAIDAIFDPYMSMEEANRAVVKATQDLAEALDSNGASFDILTEKGMANRAAVQNSVEAILAQGVALVGTGASVDEAAVKINTMTQSLKDQLLAAGFTKEEIDEYLRTLGLTPENVTTTLELAKAEETKTKLGNLMLQLGELDSTTTAEIQALIDEGKFTEAENRIREIAKEREITLKVNLQYDGDTIQVGKVGQVNYSAAGRYVDKPMISWIGEGGPEVVLPLNSPSRIRELLGDDRVAGPVSAAMGNSSVTNGGLSVGTINVGSRDDIPAMERALNRTMWRVK